MLEKLIWYNSVCTEMKKPPGNIEWHVESKFCTFEIHLSDCQLNQFMISTCFAFQVHSTSIFLCNHVNKDSPDWINFIFVILLHQIQSLNMETTTTYAHIRNEESSKWQNVHIWIVQQVILFMDWFSQAILIMYTYMAALCRANP